MINDVLLNGRNFRKVDFYTHIAAGNHNSVRNGQNGVQIVHTFLVFQFGDDADVGMIFIQNVPDLQNVLRAAHKAGRNEIKAVFDTEQNILPVLAAHIWNSQGDVRHIDAFFILNDSAVLHPAVNVGAGNALHVHADQTIVQKDLVPLMQITGKFFVGHLRNAAVSQHFAGGQSEFLTILQHGAAPIKLYQAHLRAFGVQQSGNRAIQFRSQALQHLQAAGMLGIISMRKIKTRHVHTTEDHIPQDIFPVRRRAERADDFGFPHRFLLFFRAWQHVSRRAYERASFVLGGSHRPPSFISNRLPPGNSTFIIHTSPSRTSIKY